MSAIIGFAILCAVFVQVWFAHRYYRQQKRICGTYPYYRLRDEIAWQMIQDPTTANEREGLYSLTNRIVHHTDSFGWQFLSEVVQDLTRAILEHRDIPRTPAPLEVELVDLVIASARANSVAVRLALTNWGRIVLLLPVARACYHHYRSKHPGKENGLTRRVETVRRVRRLHSWRDTLLSAAA
ncbi:MAG TPA: hypothetical protein VKB51_14580 [bacterium]|nr:hypothetical protein [bacterium]